MIKKILIVALIVLVALGLYYFEQDKTSKIDLDKFSFFITSVNPGNGGNFGGLVGADRYCQTLAEKNGSKKVWSAYLSGFDESVDKVVNAKDRIGNGPWYNFQGIKIADNIENLHSENNLNKTTALDENGNIVFGRGDERNDHDILTGSNDDGTASTTNILGTTCDNWYAATGSSAIVGHHDRIGRDESAPMKSWVTSHISRGCSLPQLRTTGGAGLIYCFAK